MGIPCEWRQHLFCNHTNMILRRKLTIRESCLTLAETSCRGAAILKILPIETKSYPEDDISIRPWLVKNHIFVLRKEERKEKEKEAKENALGRLC